MRAEMRAGSWSSSPPCSVARGRRTVHGIGAVGSARRYDGSWFMPAPHRIQRFEVVGHLGTGGMGTVFRARDPQLERDVAIKVLATSVPSMSSVTRNTAPSASPTSYTGSTFWWD